MREILSQSTPDKVAQQFYLEDDLNQSQTIILISCIFISLLSYGDYLIFGFSATFSTLAYACITFFLYSAIVLWRLRQVKTTQQHNYLVFSWAAFLVLLAIYVNISRPITDIRFFYIDPLIVLSIFVSFPSNICIPVVLASMLTIADIVIIWFFKSPISELSLKTIELTYLLANVLGLFIAYRLRQSRQKQYSFFLNEQNIRKELEQVAFIDYLTGALTRRKFLQLSFLEFKKSKSFEKPFSIIMLDVDFFKSLNDKFGHAAGDTYLKEFTKIIIENKRSNDFLGRLGGEEFALLLPDTTLDAALEVAERLRKICDEKEIYFDNQLLHTTISVGVANAREEDQTLQDVLKRADMALYQAKGNGRNQVQFCLELIDSKV